MENNTQEITAFNATEAELGDLESKYTGVVFDVTDDAVMTEAKSAYKDINSRSITLEKARKKEKAESLAYGKFVDSEAKRISSRLDVLRLPIKATIDEEVNRVAIAHEAAVQAERDRIEAEALAAQQAEEKRLADQQAEIDRQKAELAKQQKEQEDRERESRMRIETQEREARRAQEETDRIAREEAEEKARVERKAQEAKEAKKQARIREDQEKAQHKADGFQLLESFVNRFGDDPDFVDMAKSISTFLAR